MYDEAWMIVDTETSGLRAPIYALEIAAQKMRGWQRDGEPFRVLLNHDVPIDAGAEAVHGYSREYLRRHGVAPYEAHARFQEYGRQLPMVAFNLSYDWDQVLLPEYRRLGVPATGSKGFCALTLARRVIAEVDDYKLATLKERFGLNVGARSHQGRQDVETTAILFEQVMAPALYRAEVYGFAAIADFSRRTPVGACLRYIAGERSVGPPKVARDKLRPAEYYVFLPPDRVVGPHGFDRLREWLAVGAISRDTQVCREGTEVWTPLSVVPKHDFIPATVQKRVDGRRRGAGWRAWDQPATERQLMKLAYFEIAYRTHGLTKGEASILIDSFAAMDVAREAAYQAAPADADQIARLSEVGCAVENLSRAQAKALLEQMRHETFLPQAAGRSFLQFPNQQSYVA